MARQKMNNEQVQRQEMEVVPGKEEITETTEGNPKVDDDIEEGSGSGASDASSTSSESGSMEMDEELAGLDQSELFTLSQAAAEEGNMPRALQLTQMGLRKYTKELGTEMHPDLAEYWLQYGDMLLKSEEKSTGLFSGGPDDDGDENLKLAWESLDIARVLYEKRIEGLEKEGELKKQEWVELTKHIRLAREEMEEEYKLVEVPQLPLWTVREHTEYVQQTLRYAVFARMRLGDFNQAQMNHADAVQEFCAALQLCGDYGLPYPRGLELAVPLAQSFVVLDDSRALILFTLAVDLMDAELPTADPARKALLEEFKPDVLAQMKEFEEEETKLVNESAQMAAENQALERMGEDEPVDLGRVGGGRRRTE